MGAMREMRETVTVPARMKADEVADYAGVSVDAVYRCYRNGDLKGSAPRGLTRPVSFATADVVAWVGGGEDIDRKVVA